MIGIATLIVVAGVVADVVLRTYTDWLWFGEVALRSVFWRRLVIGLIVGPVCGLVFFAAIYGNIAIARHIAPRYPAFEGIDVVEYIHATASRRIRQVALPLTLLVAVIVGFRATRSWLTFARAIAGVPFGVRDPIFHHDLSFYIFTLPAWQTAYSFLFGVLLVAFFATVAVHVVLGGIDVIRLTSPDESPRFRRRRFALRSDAGAVTHVSALLGALFLVGGLGYLIKAWNLLFATTGVVFGAGYTDVHMRLLMIRVLMVLALALGVALVVNALRGRRQWWPPAAIGVWVVALVVLLGIVPAVFQALFVNPNQLAREQRYIAFNIAATRAAYGLTAATETPYSLTGNLTAATLRANDPTVRNIRLWDPETLLLSYGQLQQLRPYYGFSTVSVDRYRVNGDYRQTMLAPRELNVQGLPARARTWVNEHITYTHGFGVAVSAVNQMASGGAPDFLVQDIPVTSSAPSLTVAQPRIYYGLKGTDFVLVKTKDPEFDYPGPGGADVYRNYDGTGGIPVGSFFNRLAFCARFGTIKFFTTSAIDAQSRIIIYDAIKARLAAAAPFLALDGNPYMVVVGGRLFWIADAYTTTDRYPYSEPEGGLNYIRNSVKVVVDAYNGTMDFYVFDPADPLLRTYARIFPGMFRPRSSMPAALAQHVRYPQDMFGVQAEAFATYHVTDPGLLYNKGNQWQVPTNVSISGSGQMHPYYMIMRLPGQTREEFVLILPYTPNARANMIAWLGAESDAPSYGRAVSFAFPSSLSVYGPAQVEAAVNQDPTISAQRTLWGQQGSRVIFGNLIVVPIADSLLYVQPLYLQSVRTQLPQLQRVIAFYRSPSSATTPPSGQQQNVVMEPTLGEALTAIFGGAPPPGTAPPGATAATGATARLIARATAQYDAAQAALRTGDLAGFARQIAALGRTLTRLRALR